MTFTEQQVLDTAPDDASRKSGKDLASLLKWESTGRSAIALWGACKGSGSKPYQTQIDLQQLAFKCSCPSRKFPCKHGIALLLLYSRSTDNIPETASPAWVNEWIEKRQATQEKKAAAPVTTSTSSAKSPAVRASRVNEGIEELLRWMKDMLRNGIIHLPEKNQTYWENTARRLIDAQAPGLAGMVRNLQDIHYYQEGWQQQFMVHLLKLYTTVQGYLHLELLPELLQQDIRQQCGFTVNQEYLKSLPGITDTWQVLGKQITEQDKLITERYWLYGESSGQTALILQFYARHFSTPAFTLQPGTAIKAELVYFPSVKPLRAVLKEYKLTASPMHFHGMHQWSDVLAHQTDLCSSMPVYPEQLYTVQSLQLVPQQQQWLLMDQQRQLMALKPGSNKLWKLLAITGGHAMPMAVTGAGNYYEPIGVWSNEHYQAL
ncbi:SWIM zinc finger family protein [Chitinophaga sp. sic0106]|nr:SWIM zinc finger family protein [Chitinophaga sp. sic0106]